MNKKIVYFAVLLDGSRSGMAKKVDDQVNIWRKKGYQVEVLVLTGKKFLNDWEGKSGYSVYFDGIGMQKVFQRYKLSRVALDRRPNILYIRESFPFLLPRTRYQSKIVLEVQSKLQPEIFHRSFLLGTLSILIDFFYLRKIDKFIFVSSEISQSFRFKKYIHPGNFAIISNGIQLDRIAKLELPPNSKECELIFLGQDGQFWNGVEQIIDLAKSLPEFKFHVIGPSQPFDVQLHNVFFYGKLTEEEYLPIAAKCSVAIGTLNLRAKKMKEGSSLKLREYLALGLPAIIRYADSDFMTLQDFILQIPDNQEPITNFSGIIEDFTKRWRGKRVSRDVIEHIDMDVKESIRLNFIF